MRNLPRTVLAALACVVGVLGAGAALPALVMGDGLDRYEGADRGYAGFVLVYDLTLKEWPFPIDPTVARRVEGVRERVPPSDKGEECASPDNSGGPYGHGAFSGDYSAEVIHYGPFFVPTGKNVFRCDGARTIRYPEVAPGEPFFFAYGLAVMAWALVVLVGVPVAPAALLLGGAWLLVRGGTERADRVVGSVACVEGAILVLAGGVYLFPVLCPLCT